MIDYHVITDKGEAHIMTAHSGQGDATPLQLISGARLEYYMTLERALLTFIESIATVLPSAPANEPTGPAVSQ